MRDTLRLDGKTYTLLRQGDAPVWNVSARPSQRGDPGGQEVAEWRIDGPDLNSIEDVSQGQGFLGREYGDGTDGRWAGLDTIGPLINTVTLSTYDASHAASIFGTATMIFGSTAIFGAALTAAVADGIALFQSKLYLTRGGQLAKVNVSTMAVERPPEALIEPATSLLVTEAAASSDFAELSIGQGEQAPYRTIYRVADHPNSDTFAENADGQSARIFGQGDDRVFALTGKQVLGNELSGSVTMKDGNWQSVDNIREYGLRFTGFAMDGNLPVLGTNRGPYYLNTSVTPNKHTAWIRELVTQINENNCKNMTPWFALGVVLPLANGVRYLQRGWGESWGVTRFPYNTSPVQGFPTATSGSTEWLYQTIYNAVTGDTNLVCWKPPGGDAPVQSVLVPYVIARFPSLRSDALLYIDTANGVRTNPTLVGGYGSNMFYMTVGRTTREIDDTNYRYGAAGTTHLTEMRRGRGLIYDLEAVELGSASCTATQTITLGVIIDGGSVNSLTGTLDYTGGSSLNGVINTNGHQRLLFVDDSNVPLSWATGRRVKPRLTYATNVNTAAPQAVGPLRLFYRTRPLIVNSYGFAVVLADSIDGTAEEQEEHLLRLVGRTVGNETGDRRVLVNEDPQGDTYYARVESVKVKDVDDKGGDKGSVRGKVRVAEVEMVEWTTTA